MEEVAGTFESTERVVCVAARDPPADAAAIRQSAKCAAETTTVYAEGTRLTRGRVRCESAGLRLVAAASPRYGRSDAEEGKEEEDEDEEAQVSAWD